MARGKLLGLLRAIARDYGRAEAKGMSPEDYRAAKRGPSRRDVMGGLASLTALAASGAMKPLAAAAGMAGPQVAIIGGGIAGLTAALTLATNGVSATVFEASDRLGGRMHSLRGFWQAGQVSEWGGELIDTNHKTILKLAARYGLQVDDVLAAEPAGSTDTYWFGGTLYSVNEAYSDFKAIWPALKEDRKAAGYPTLWNSFTDAGQALDQMSIHQWIASRVPGGNNSRMGRLLAAAYTEEYGAEITDQSALNLIYLLGYQPNGSSFSIFGASDERYHLNGGNDLIPTSIVNELSGPDSAIDFVTQMPMTGIAVSGSKIAVYFKGPSGSSTRLFDRVILAIPFSILRKLNYVAADFDERKVLAITSLGSGRSTKLQLQFNSRYWNNSFSAMGATYSSNGGVYSDQGFQNAWETSRGQAGAQGLLVNFTGGNVAGSYSPQAPYTVHDGGAYKNNYVKSSASDFLNRLNVVFPGISGQWNGQASLSTPFLDRNLGLSYSYFRVGQYTQFAGYERVPQGAIHFAGEHCSLDFQGYMEGGAVEGVRAGLEVVLAVTGKKGMPPV